VTNPTTFSFLRRARGVTKRDMFQYASVRLDAAAVGVEPQSHYSNFLVIARDPSTHVTLVRKGFCVALHDHRRIHKTKETAYG
jgi:hypothetical protein